MTFKLTRIETTNPNIKIVDISHCSFCLSNPSLNQNGHYSMYNSKSIDISSLCNICYKKYLSQPFNSVLYEIAKKKLQLNSSNLHFLSPYFYNYSSNSSNSFLSVLNRNLIVYVVIYLI